MTPPVLPFFTDETEHTMVGMPAPLHLPALPARKSYVERYPPRLDAPVVVEIRPADEETVVVDVPAIWSKSYEGEHNAIVGVLGEGKSRLGERFTTAQIAAGLDPMRARRSKP